MLPVAMPDSGGTGVRVYTATYQRRAYQYNLRQRLTTACRPKASMQPAALAAMPTNQLYAQTTPIAKYYQHSKLSIVSCFVGSRDTRRTETRRRGRTTSPPHLYLAAR